MPSKKSTTVVLTEKSQKIKDEISVIYGMKNILSAGVLLFDRLSEKERNRIISEAHGLDLDIPENGHSHGEVAEVVRYVKKLSPDGSFSVEMLSKEDQAAIDELVKLAKPRPGRKNKKTS